MTFVNPEQAQVADLAARIIKGGFENYRREFDLITRRARIRFDQRDWYGMQQDALQRLDVYNECVMQAVAQVRGMLGQDVHHKPTWAEMKSCYSRFIAGLNDFELAETFFNSITRRIFSTVGVDPNIEFVDSDFETPPDANGPPIFNTYHCQGTIQRTFLAVWQDYPFSGRFQDIQLDADLAARRFEHHIQSLGPACAIEIFEFVRPVFYRNKGAYILGRARLGDRFIPLVFSLRHLEQGIQIDALLMTEDEVSIIFSFTRSYFHVEASQPRQLIAFLKSIMPLKRVAELYISIGYNKHGKTELYRHFLQHLETSTDHFTTARGEKGMVMLVFTLPSYDLVFKIIRDKFGDPKTTTHQDVKERYQLVFKHDRAGRLVDAQEFEHLRFETSRFSPDLLQELLDSAPSSVTVEGEFVAIKHLYIERRLVPLNIYLQEAQPENAREVVVDYGFAIKDLAATNIFPGDILLKNFGVTRHGRVVFYDYDELSLLSVCRFRHIPAPRSFSDEFEAEPWFYVDKYDIFPEEFNTFLGLRGELRDIFTAYHHDLFEVEFWRSMQERVEAGEVVDIYPYKLSRKLRHQLAE